MIKLGDRVKDKITGFEGIVVARVEHLYGCIRCSVQPEKLNKDGKPIENQYFDEPQLDLILHNATVGAAMSAQPAKHGPRQDPPRREG